MEVREIRVTVKFERQYKKLPEAVRRAARDKEIIFRQNPFDARIATHKLHGIEKEAWSFSVTHSHRIKFVFLTSHSVLFLEIGAHDIYS
jgi:mRNA-degrading endonuclease YafQ of YafQ-DinJ toxin-antitoxin module